MNMMFYRPIYPHEFEILTEAIQAWYLHYGASARDDSTPTLCNAAVEFYNAGDTTLDALSARLIATFHGPDVLRVNAPTSGSIH
jgi:hypothetical protein